MTDENKILRLLFQCAKYRLDGTAYVACLPMATLVRAYNGIGPDWVPEAIREAYTKLHADLEPMALIHDVDYELSDGSHEKFVLANERLRANGYKIADAKYGWWNLMRYIRRAQVSAFYRLCCRYGWTAYEAAHKKKTSVG